MERVRPLLAALLFAGCATASADEPLTAEAIVASAYDAAGGETWRRPRTLAMTGYGIFYDGAEPVRHERHSMWRVYDAAKTNARSADGKVRIESVRDGVPVIDVAFDGETTSTARGPQPKSAADARWASNFGFGVIRHALEDGYTVNRLPDEPVDGRAAYTLRVTDPQGGDTLFAIRQSDFAIVKVAFDTERGWHERTYSDFFSKPDTSWQQPGRVRLTYDGVKANEVIWTDFEVNADLPDCLFVLPEVEGCRLYNK